MKTELRRRGEEQIKMELSSMKEWLSSLSEEDLIRAMTFTFTFTRTCTGNHNRDHKAGTLICHEYDLLVEMLSLQVPPPTPIHPRAMPMGMHKRERGVTTTTTSDGKNEVRRIMKERFIRPRLFKFMERRERERGRVGFDSDDDNSILDLDNFDLPADMPPEIASLIMNERNKNINVGKKKSNKKKKKKKRGDSNGVKKSGSVDSGASKDEKHYDIIARNFITASGEVLSLGPTQSMRDADEMILLCTHIQSGCRCRQQRQNMNGNGYNSATTTTKPIICTFRGGEYLRQRQQLQQHRQQQDHGAACRSSSILEMLHIVSRGRCFTKVPAMSTVKNNDKDNDHDTKTKTFFAPWFEPTKDWFSLPLYIASRFEAALWDIFLARNTHTRTLAEPEPPSRTIIEDSFQRLTMMEGQRILLSAGNFALKKVLSSESPNPNTFLNIRDLFLYKLLSFEKDILSMLQTSDQLHLVPLLRLGAESDKFRIYMIERCEVEFAKIAEMELLSQTSTASSVSPTFNSSLKNTKRKRKKKKKRRSSHHQRKTENALGSIKENKIDDPTSTSTSSTYNVDEPTLTSSSLPIPVAGMNIPDEETNKTTIMVLEVLDGIYNNVFSQLGFDEGSHSDDGYNKATAKHSKAEHTMTRNRNMKNEKYVLRKSKKQQKQYCITRSKSSEKKDSLTNVFLENQMTMKRNNLSQVTMDTTSNTNTIWDFVELRKGEQQSSMTATAYDSSHLQHQTFQRPSYQPNFTSLFTPPPQQIDTTSTMNRTNEHSFFNSPGVVGLPLQSDDALLHDLRSYEYRQSSHIFDLFDDSDDKDANFASSTAASIASSILDNEYDDVSSDEELNDDSRSNVFEPIFEEDDGTCKNVAEEEEEVESCGSNTCSRDRKDPNQKILPRPISDTSPPIALSNSSSFTNTSENLKLDGEKIENTENSERSHHSLSDAPDTPPPQLSPIIVSLEDLGELRKRGHFRSVSDIGEDGTLPDDIGIGRQSSGKANITMHRSYSREDLRLPSTRDDPYGRHKPPCSSRTVDFSTLSYRNAAMKNPQSRRAKSVASQDLADYTKRRTLYARKTPNTKPFAKISFTKEVIIGGQLNVCAQSESALDDNEDSSHWNVVPRIAFDENDNATATRDGATTISSMPAPHDLDELAYLREEKNAYQDMYLTMAAEVSKLRNMLALERINSGLSMQPPAPVFANVGYSKSFDPECMPPFFHARQKGVLRKYAAMSDAGLNDVQMSEDGTETMQGSVIMVDGKRRISRTNSMNNNRMQNFAGGKVGAGSDVASLEYDNTTYSAIPSYTIHKNAGPEALNVFQSRLSRDIDSFLADITSKLRKQEKRKLLAIKRLSLLVTTIWPRAQVKMYGSHQCDLRLPSSDLDFVICLPNVHKNTPADTPGALEGRNAINESNQKLFARKLKSESWIGEIKIMEKMDFIYYDSYNYRHTCNRIEVN